MGYQILIILAILAIILAIIKVQTNKCKAEYKLMIKKQKQKSWNEYIAANARDPYGLPYKLARRKIKKQFTLDLIEGQTLEEQIKNMLTKCFPPDDPTRDTKEQKEIRTEDHSQKQNGTRLTSFSKQEISPAIRKLANKKAAGPD